MNENISPPFFVGIGAQRAGTSWLYSCLKEHPEIFMPRKEMHFFDNNYTKGVEWYCNQFSNGSEKHRTGEFTPDYMSNFQALERIANLSKQIKLIVILREPIERAYSATQLYKSHGQFRDIGFNDLLAKEPSFLKKSLYSKQIKDVYSLFPKENVLVCLFDDIEKDANSFYQDVCRFLSIDGTFKPSIINTKKNISSMSTMQSVINLPKLQKKLLTTKAAPLVRYIKTTSLYMFAKKKLLNWSDTRNNSNYHAEISKDTRKIVVEDIKKLELETGLDLSNWLKIYS
ncbi:sulfotransferase domain-containing protein [Paraglaciecola aquimarina]|uniref:Sulfotransferase domain-containing protein n=1 Tax=Paraglaciecola algarum TaxID=3050085 RepID=A0ABS9D7W2_9ALTE|nr:sulfotransferase domain-containing protein [Paraglaciecola sp. G1-23]MCF2947756.1 sulfotransferase domain-containing protein [Paraglaciecola sp. G1-23]